MRTLLFFCFVSITLLSVACGGGETAENQNANSNSMQELDPANMPPGLSGEPVKPSAESTPGIPAPGEANKVPKGATPTPGIPDPATLGKPLKPGATPTPGIPSPEEIKKMLEEQKKSANANSKP